MRVGQITNIQSNRSNVVSDSISFGTYNPSAAKKIEKELAQKGFMCDVKGNDFVGECYKKTVAVFNKLFGKPYMPKKLAYEELYEGAYGVYDCIANEVSINKYYNYGCFENMDKLKAKAREMHGFILPGWNSSKHPGHVFMHEFAHAAHWHHLRFRNGQENAMKVWQGLVGTTVPTGIGRLIAKFKLSEYAVEANDMCEFMAERIAKDVCRGLNEDAWTQEKPIDVKYDNIFSRKWDYRYSSPQAYIDYFTQQVWNGDIDGANRTGRMAEEYLKEIESAERVAPTVTKIANVLDHIPKGETKESRPLIYKIGSFISKQAVNANKKLTQFLDERNKLRVHKDNDDDEDKYKQLLH